MPPQWLVVVSSIYLILSFLCALVIAGDMLAGRPQTMWVMNLVWPITALYFGPLGLWAYWAFGRPKAATARDRATPDEGADDQPGGGGEGERVGENPSWPTTLKATSHCGAGCTLGDTIGEWAIFLIGFTWFGSKLLTAFVLDFLLAYAFGIAFQYFTIAPMRGLGLRDGLIAAVKADTISLVAFEVGMFGWMALMRLVLFDPPLEPNQVTYWFMMQIAMIIGFATSFPANWFLVKYGIKERM